MEQENQTQQQNHPEKPKQPTKEQIQEIKKNLLAEAFKKVMLNQKQVKE